MKQLFSEIKSECKTTSQRRAFNKLVKSFANNDVIDEKVIVLYGDDMESLDNDELCDEFESYPVDPELLENFSIEEYIDEAFEFYPHQESTPEIRVLESYNRKFDYLTVRVQLLDKRVSKTFDEIVDKLNKYRN